MSDISLENQFTYTPPKTKERIDKHDAVNKASLEFAKLIDNIVVDVDYKKQIIQHIQTARMIANQAITFEEIDSL